MLASTIMLVLMCALSVAGVVEPDGVYQDAVVFRHDISPFVMVGDRLARVNVSFQMGGMILRSTYKPNVLEHEYGGLLVQREMGKYYLPVSLAYSVMDIISKCLGYDSKYHDYWTEKRADEFGGVIR